MTWRFSAVAMQCDLQQMIDTSTAFFAQYDVEQKSRMFLPSMINHDQAEWDKWLEIGHDPDTGWTVARWYQPAVCVTWVEYLASHLRSTTDKPLLCYAVNEEAEPEFEHYSSWTSEGFSESYTRHGLDCWLSNHLLDGELGLRFEQLKAKFFDEPAIHRFHEQFSGGFGANVLFDLWQEWVAPLSVQEMLTVCDEFATPFMLPHALRDIAQLSFETNRLSGTKYLALTPNN